MTTREIYFKHYTTTNMPIIFVGYIMKDHNGVIQIGNNIPIRFDDGHEENIKIMEEIEKTEGFMFWNISGEGKKLIKEAMESIFKNKLK